MFEEWGQMLNIAAVRVGSRPDLMRGGSERVQLSVLAARAATALRVLDSGHQIDQDDRDVLEAMSALLSKAARSFEFFSSHGEAGMRPRGALSAQVDAAIDAVSAEANAPAVELVEQTLLRLSADAHAAAESKTADSSSLARFFEDLANAVLQETGHAGEVIATL